MTASADVSTLLTELQQCPSGKGLGPVVSGVTLPALFLTAAHKKDHTQAASLRVWSKVISVDESGRECPRVQNSPQGRTNESWLRMGWNVVWREGSENLQQHWYSLQACMVLSSCAGQLWCRHAEDRLLEESGVAGWQRSRGRRPRGQEIEGADRRRVEVVRHGGMAHRKEMKPEGADGPAKKGEMKIWGLSAVSLLVTNWSRV